MSLPEITEVQRLRIEPGDCLVVTTDMTGLPRELAEDIQRQVSSITGIKAPIIVLPRDWRIEVVSEEGHE